MNVLDRTERVSRRTKAAGLAMWALWALYGPGVGAVRAAEPAPDKKAESPTVPAAVPAAGEMTVEQVAERCRPSIVVITFDGRDGKRQGLGSGFIVSPDGMIATNLHVIGEGRAISVQLADGRTFVPTVVHAHDRTFDLALLKIDAKDLPTVPLGDATPAGDAGGVPAAPHGVRQGQSVVALGNPLGLKHSLFTGVVSGAREIEGRSMIQVSMPIEQGNSGGPLLDLSGRVRGIITMKSLVTANLGFAVPVADLKKLVDKPNPVPMDRWLTIGRLDPKEWDSLFGARWRQRAGRLMVDGAGTGFGGRSLLLSKLAVPAGAFQLGVQVRLGAESGAAGLVFCADGGDVHYGFYPSGGKLRLTRFDGPDVFSWQVLRDEPVAAYRPGEWNALKVVFEPGKIRCFVNEQPAFEVVDTKLSGGRVGLAKFRDTQAEFKQFRVGGGAVAEAGPAEGFDTRLSEVVDGLKPAVPYSPATVEKLRGDGGFAVAALRERARMIEKQADQMRKLAASVHEAAVRARIAELVTGAVEGRFDLVHACLLVSQLDNEEVDVDEYLREVERMSAELKERSAGLDEAAKIALLKAYFFEEQGFHGSRAEYYHRSNSYLNEVLDDREGIPITLSILFMELARRMELKVDGVGFPGHFFVRYVPTTGEPVELDPFEGGKTLTGADLQGMAVANVGRALRETDVKAVDSRTILLRVLSNLLNLARRDEDSTSMLRYVEAVLTVDSNRGEERFIRAVLSYQQGRNAEARADAQWLLDQRPEDVDLDRVRQFVELLDRR